ncbi:MAG: hypothetical protein WD033_04560 [Nitrosopumilaceae archaeon]
MNMIVRKDKLLALCCFFVIAVALIMPAYADIKSFKTDKTFYKKGDKIIFSGTTEEEDVGEFVTVIIEDPAGNFVTLGSGYVTIDKNFTVTIDTNAKKIKEKFASQGVYNATGFVENKTNSVWKTFDFSLDGSPVIHPTSQPAPTPQPTQQPAPTPQPTQQSSSQSSEENENESNSDELTIQEKIKERIEAAQKQKEAQANPPPQTESGSTADQTTTGESTTTSGDTTVTGDKSGTTGISTPIDLGSNMLYVVIGLGGAGAIAGVVYGIKNKNRHNQDDKPVVKIREPSVKSTPSEDDYALMILKNRLAKGEITIDEFNALKEALKEP